jgi:uncharacterized membrane protein YesL
MRPVLRVFWQSLRDFYDEIFMLGLMNILTVVLAIPVVTFPPALAGLWSAANLVVQGNSIAWHDYFDGFRRYFWKAWGLALVNIVVVAVLATNLWFYNPDTAPFDISDNLSFGIRLFWGIVTAVWVMLQMYPLALLMEQEDQRLRTTWRNAAVLLFANPGFSLVLAILLAIVGFISTLIPLLWAIVTVSLFAVACNKAVRHLLEPYRERLRSEAEEGQAGEEGQEEEEVEE